MTSANQDTVYDAIVVGGGPAGSSLGRLLALWGHRVLLLARNADRRRGQSESIPPSARRLLATIEVLDDVDRVAFAPNRGNVVWWANSAPRFEAFDRGQDGWLVFRPDLDRVLLACAQQAGVDVQIDATALAIHRGANGLTRVDYEAAGQARAATARFVADCSGRTGVLARRGLRRAEPVHRMQAYLGWWHDTTLGSSNDRTLVETYDDGWVWSLPASPAIRQVAAMVDGASPATRGSVGEALTTALGRTTEFRRRFRGVTLEHAWACDASMYSAHRFHGPGFVLVGDAGCAIDPLSSFGVKKALGSAWLAAVALHTACVDPSREDLALEFFTHREQEIYEAERARTSAYAQEAFAAHGGTFWAARAAGAGAVAPRALEASLLQRSEVAAAHQQLRSAGFLEAQTPGRLSLIPHPVVRGREIVLDEALQFRQGPLRFALDVDLKALVGVTTHRCEVLHAHEAYCRTVAAVPLPNFLAAAALLLAEGVLTTHASAAQ